MAQYIDKDALAAAIKKRYKFLERKKEFNSHNIEYEIRMSECQHLMLLFNSIETKEVNLEKEIRETCHGYRATDSYDATISKEGIGNIARYFFNLGLKTQKGE